jgi:regulator of protease activity HflC (stomatin/prohibitin superfamily)
MKAERTRRALVTQAEGDRQAAITRAEGEQQATILNAEGARQQQVLAAQGEAEARRAIADAERYRQEAIAAGQANATKITYEAIHEGNPTTDLLAIKYLEALQGLANGQATKIIVPADMSGIAGSLAGIAELFNGDPPRRGADG